MIAGAGRRGAPVLEITLKNTPDERQRLVKALESFALEQNLPAKAVEAADLALEEHLTNVFAHGFHNQAEAELLVRLTRDGDWLQIEIEDEGRVFNPLSQPPVDTSLPLEGRPIGGLGIHLIRQFMDELDYRRERERNIFIMRKRLQ